MIEYHFLGRNYEPVQRDIDSFNHLLNQLTTSQTITISPEILIGVARNSKLLVARTNLEGDIVGMATLSVVSSLLGRFGYVGDVVVDGEFRKSGIGRGLLERIIAKAEALKLQKLDLTTIPEEYRANHLFQMNGFEMINTNNWRRKI